MTEPSKVTSFTRPEVRQLLDMIAGLDGPAIREAGPVAGREMMRMMGAEFERPTGDLALIRNIAMPVTDGGELPLRLFDCRSSRPAGPVVVFYHGGGFVIGDRDCYDSACAEIARQMDMPVVSVEYRLAPEHIWPAAPEDCEAAARWIASNPELLEREVTGIVLMGDSAGGNLAIVTAMALRDRPAAVPVLAQCPLYPVTDLDADTVSKRDYAVGHLLEAADLDWFYDQYSADRRHWRASPLVAAQADMPPTVVVTCSLDPLCDEGRAYAESVRDAGVSMIHYEAPGMIHGFLNFRKALPSANHDLAMVTAALRTILAVGDRRAAPPGQ